MNGRQMFRYTVPVDDEPHMFALTGKLVAVAAASADRVEFWAESDESAPYTHRVLQVFGTGQPLPDDAQWVGTCARTSGLVWHLYERTAVVPVAAGSASRKVRP